MSNADIYHSMLYAACIALALINLVLFALLRNKTEYAKFLQREVDRQAHETRRVHRDLTAADMTAFSTDAEEELYFMKHVAPITGLHPNEPGMRANIRRMNYEHRREQL
jgi:hypothetical protein